MSESSDFDSEESDHEDTIYDEIKLSEMSFEPDNEEENGDGEAESKDADGNGSFYYPCPCGDRFVITLEELRDNEEIAYCPSCSLKIRVLYDPAELAGQYWIEESNGREPCEKLYNYKLFLKTRHTWRHLSFVVLLLPFCLSCCRCS